MHAYFNPGSYLFSGAGVPSGTITVAVTGGSGSFTYAFSKVSGSGTLSGSSGNQATVTGLLHQTVSATFQCIVTDTVTGMQMTCSCTVTFESTG
jgi:hypothetical protein